MASRRPSISTLLLAVVLVGLAAVVVVSRFERLDFIFGEVALSAHHSPTTEFPVPSAEAVRSPEGIRQPPLAATDGPPSNVILLIGDGMGVGLISTVASIDGGPTAPLTLESAPVVGLVKTWAEDRLVTDSAASATAMATGFKVPKRAISKASNGEDLKTLFEAATDLGMSVGAITTSGLADATPSAFVAHVDHRDKYATILEQMLESDATFLIGGDWSAKKKAKLQADYLELVKSTKTSSDSPFNIIHSADQLATTDPPVLALFPTRPGSSGAHGPQLEESVGRGLDLLSQNPTGFILVIEAEDTDEYTHDNDLQGSVAGVLELQKALDLVLEFAATDSRTLVLLTADHDTGNPAIVSGRFEEGVARVVWGSDEHNATWVPSFAWGPGATAFNGVFDNTEIARRIAAMLGFEGFPPPSRPVPAG